MDKRIRRNETCIIGLPRCDFVFSSTRTCFIAYGFEESTLEMGLLRKILLEKDIEPIEAGGFIAPAQNAFCAKICSKIITSQFSIVLINNDLKNGQEIPNANINMEYGLMLGFNKYVLPFQKTTQQLPFNVAGLDTIKYTNKDFEEKAIKAIELAIKTTNQDTSPIVGLDQILDTFILLKKAMLTPLNSIGEKDLYNFGSPLGFNLLNSFSGLNYMFLGNFSSLRPEVILWRVRMLDEIIRNRRSTMKDRVTVGIYTDEQMQIINKVLDEIQIWLIVTSDDDKNKIHEALKDDSLIHKIQLFSIDNIYSEVIQGFS